jgi:hypothetical protein
MIINDPKTDLAKQLAIDVQDLMNQLEEQTIALLGAIEEVKGIASMAPQIMTEEELKELLQPVKDPLTAEELEERYKIYFGCEGCD